MVHFVTLWNSAAATCRGSMIFAGTSAPCRCIHSQGPESNWEADRECP
jgi:hypothetical protein